VALPVFAGLDLGALTPAGVASAKARLGNSAFYSGKFAISEPRDIDRGEKHQCKSRRDEHIIEKAIGPQKTVGAIGIMPSTVDTAVSMIGRKRELLASMTACNTSFPCARSLSI
jgi:hypothetical protein